METGWSEQDEESDEKFKSYYVVWKLFPKKHHNWRRKKFKSYYVVWKPFSWGEIHQSTQRLNRTM